MSIVTNYLLTCSSLEEDSEVTDGPLSYVPWAEIRSTHFPAVRRINEVLARRLGGTELFSCARHCAGGSSALELSVFLGATNHHGPSLAAVKAAVEAAPWTEPESVRLYVCHDVCNGRSVFESVALDVGAKREQGA